MCLHQQRKQHTQKQTLNPANELSAPTLKPSRTPLSFTVSSRRRHSDSNNPNIHINPLGKLQHLNETTQRWRVNLLWAHRQSLNSLPVFITLLCLLFFCLHREKTPFYDNFPLEFLFRRRGNFHDNECWLLSEQTIKRRQAIMTCEIWKCSRVDARLSEFVRFFPLSTLQQCLVCIENSDNSMLQCSRWLPRMSWTKRHRNSWKTQNNLQLVERRNGKKSSISFHFEFLICLCMQSRVVLSSQRFHSGAGAMRTFHNSIIQSMLDVGWDNHEAQQRRRGKKNGIKTFFFSLSSSRLPINKCSPLSLHSWSMLKSWRVKEICERIKPTRRTISRDLWWWRCWVVLRKKRKKKQQTRTSWFCAFFVFAVRAASIYGSYAHMCMYVSMQSQQLAYKHRKSQRVSSASFVRTPVSEIWILSLIHYQFAYYRPNSSISVSC